MDDKELVALIKSKHDQSRKRFLLFVIIAL